mmetsp:Transcript_9863/g.25549  ORF Transcript_9863/g.25549 Transcript_9863/m.25549 type:complete len:174 (-) Transcript_9863:100-621(-)
MTGTARRSTRRPRPLLAVAIAAATAALTLAAAAAAFVAPPIARRVVFAQGKAEHSERTVNVGRKFWGGGDKKGGVIPTGVEQEDGYVKQWSENSGSMDTPLTMFFKEDIRLKDMPRPSFLPPSFWEIWYDKGVFIAVFQSLGLVGAFAAIFLFTPMFLNPLILSITKLLTPTS